MADELIINFAVARDRGRLWDFFKKILTGTYRITIVKHRPRHSDRQRRFYFPAFCKAVADFLTEQGESTDLLDVHEGFKEMFLPAPTRVDRETGEVLFTGRRTTSTLSTSEFNEYLDKCGSWMWDKLGIPFPDPSVYHERDEPGQSTEGE